MASSTKAVTNGGGPIQIDQIIHGYDRGHRELASSRQLEDTARSAMASLSDLLTTTPLRNGEHYLAIYPLKSASAHVVARTWPAGDGYRPGSVWTHSLLLSYEALALLPDLTQLQTLFLLPGEKDLSAYHEPLFIDPAAAVEPLDDDPRASAALFQIYGSHQETITLPTTPTVDADLALALWSQMWPALRREFSALTMTCDKQQSLPGRLKARFQSKSSNINLPANWMETRGLEQLTADLHVRGPTELRSFLARYAVEADNPRRMALPLAWYFGNENVPARQMIDDMRKTAAGHNLPRLSRDLILADFAKAGDSERFVELVRNTRDEEIVFDIGPIVTQATTLASTVLSALLPVIAVSDRATLGAGLFEALVDRLPPDRLAAISSIKIKQILLERRVELAKERTFWPKADSKRAKLLERISEKKLTWQDTDHLFGDNIGPKTAMVLIKRSEPLSDTILSAMLSHPSDAMREASTDWLFREPERMNRLGLIAKQMTQSRLKQIAARQIEMPTHFDAKTWANILGEAGNTKRGKELTVVGAVAALVCARQKDFTLAKAGALELLALYRDGRLSSAQFKFADQTLPYGRYGIELDDRIIKQLLRKWPDTASSMAILEGAAGLATQKDIIRAIEHTHGRSVLRSLSEERGLAEPIRRQIETYLVKTKPIFSPFGWLFN